MGDKKKSDYRSNSKMMEESKRTGSRQQFFDEDNSAEFDYDS